MPQLFGADCDPHLVGAVDRGCRPGVALGTEIIDGHPGRSKNGGSVDLVASIFPRVLRRLVDFESEPPSSTISLGIVRQLAATFGTRWQSRSIPATAEGLN